MQESIPQKSKDPTKSPWLDVTIQDCRPHDQKDGNVYWESPIADGIAKRLASFLLEQNSYVRINFDEYFELVEENGEGVSIIEADEWIGMNIANGLDPR